jgi:hypothetical protein
MMFIMCTARSFWMTTVFGSNTQSKCALQKSIQYYETNVLFFSENVLRTLAHELHHFKVEKNELGWDLEELEQIAEQMKDMQDEMEQDNERDMQRAEMIL